MACPKVCLGKTVFNSGRNSYLRAYRFCQPAERAVGGIRANCTSQSQPKSDFKNIGVGFSAGGLLFPYHIGAADGLVETGLLTKATPCAGSSAGSLISSMYHSGVTTAELMEGTIKLCDDCRENGTRGRLRRVLENVLREYLPEDAHIKCSGKAHVAITQVYPFNQAGGRIVSEFESREDLIQTMLTSCHIPMWFNNTLTTFYRNGVACDGGLVDFVPGPAACDRVVRICCFPMKGWGEKFGVDIAPDTYRSSKYSMSELLNWAFLPPEIEQLWELYEIGKRDALDFANSSDIHKQPVVEVDTSGTGVWSRLRSVLTR